MVMKEPLSHFIDTYPFDVDNIEKIVIGEIYCAIQLKNGRIGVCATLLDPPTYPSLPSFIPDLSSNHDRIIYNAYLNALVNADWPVDGEADIFDAVPFEKGKQNVMIGFFKPVVAHFDHAGIGVTVFDMAVDHKRVTAISEMPNCLSTAHCIILTATTILNGSFFDVLKQNVNHAPIYILGPSAILHDDMFLYPDIKGIFGMAIGDNDDNVLKVIENNGGTRDFNIFATKVFRSFA